MAKKQKIVVTKAKKKTAIARARIKKGDGSVKINSVPLGVYGNAYTRGEIEIPLTIATGVIGENKMDVLDIDVNVRGGGSMGQAEAAKSSIAKALVGWTESEELKGEFIKYDRNLVVDDVRRKEAKKALRKGARAKKQKSYR